MRDNHTGGSKLGLIELALLCMVAIWGINGAIIKIAYRQFDPLAFTCLRFILPPILFGLILLVMDRSFRLTKLDWLWFLAAGLTGTTIFQVLYHLGLNLSDAADAAIIMAATPAIVVCFNHALGRGSLALRGWLGIVIAFIGVTISLSDHPDFGFESRMWRGYALMGLADFVLAGYIMISEPLMRRHPPLRVTALSIILGSIPLVLITFPALVGQCWQVVDWRGWSCLLYSSVLSIVVAWFLYNLCMQRIGGARVAVYQNLIAAVAIVAAALLLGESITQVKAGGVAIILLGVYLVRTAKLA
jgi:drug/metabolite transporter (DMT)-like permease